MGVWAQTLADGVYTIKNEINKRGTLVAVEDQVNVGAADITLGGYEGKSETSMTDGDKWYVCTKGNSVYFYNVANGQFLNGRTADQVQFSKQPQADGFALVAHDDYFAIVTGNYKLSCCPGYEKGQTVRWLTDDEAASQHLTFAAVENGATTYATQINAAETELAKIVRFSYSFVYDGEEKYSQDCASFVDADYPAITKNFPFGVVASKPSGKVSADVAGTKVEVNLTFNLPFEYVESIEDYKTLSEEEEATGKWKWYYLTFHANNKRKLYYDGSAKVLDASKSAVEKGNEDAYSWAFVGNPFDGFKVVNKLAGAEKGLQAGADGGYVGDAAEVFKLTTSTYGVKGFFMQAATGDNTQRFNFSNNQVKYWSDADAGSTFMVELRKTEKQRRIELVAEVNQLLEDNEWNHTEEPELGQYTTAGYEALSEIAEDADATIESLEAAVLAFDLTKNRPIFTIDGVVDYASGMSIYDDPVHVNAKGNSHYFKTTDVTDEYMLWTFDLTDTFVGVTDAVKVRNLGSGNLFWGAPAIVVTETSPAIEDDGVFLFYANGGDPVHAQEDNKVITKWNAKDAASGSAWKFTFVGVSNPAAYDLSEVKETFAAQVEAFAALGENEAFTVLEEMKNNWSFVNNRMQEMAGTIEAGGLVLKSDVESAMRQMAGYLAVPEAYAAYKIAKADADAAIEALKDAELSEDDQAAYVTLQNTVAMMDETFPYASSAMDISTYKGMLENASAPFYDIDAKEVVEGTEWGEAYLEFDGERYPVIENADLKIGEDSPEAWGMSLWATEEENVFEYDKVNGVLKFTATDARFVEDKSGNKDNAAYLQKQGEFATGKYRLTGKAYYKNAVNAEKSCGYMFVGEKKIPVMAVTGDVALGAEHELVYEFTAQSTVQYGMIFNESFTVGYSCEFENPGDEFVVGGFKIEMIEMFESPSLREEFQTAYSRLDMSTMSTAGFANIQYKDYYPAFEALHPAYEALLAEVDAIYDAMDAGQKVLKAKVAKATEDMKKMEAEMSPVIDYAMNDEYQLTIGSATTDQMDKFMKESDAYQLIKDAYDDAKDLSEVTELAQLQAKVAAIKKAIADALAQIPTKITLNKDEVVLNGERTVQLTATVEGSETADKSVFWESDTKEVVTVNEDGLVTVVGKIGEAYITAYSIHKSVYAECYINVTALPTGIDGFEVKVETVIYDIHGRQVEKMEKGFYIVNGKKVFVK